MLNRTSGRQVLLPMLIAGALAGLSWFLLRPTGLVGRRLALGPRPPQGGSELPLVPASDSIAFTPSSPAVDRLRAAVRDANIVICVIDAARADHIGCYGYPRPTTPNIDRLSGESVVFERHFCQFPHTFPSTASLMTGQYPDAHLAQEPRVLGRRMFTIAQGLGAYGLHTAGFSSNPWVSPTMGLGRHFARRHFRANPPVASRTPSRVRHTLVTGDEPPEGTEPESLLRLVAEWLAEPPPFRFFAYLHFMPPHKPYNAPEDMKQLFAGRDPPSIRQGPFEFPEVAARLPERNKDPGRPVRELLNSYDASMRYADWAVGEVEALLRRARVFDDTLFIVTSDHGEAFGEHGYVFHSCGVYDELIHIPLVMRFPRGERPRARVAALTETVDLLPTIFDLLRAPAPAEQIQGRSLVPLLAGDAEKVHDYIFARDGGEAPSYLVRSLDAALILYQGGKLRALYDLAAAPGQTRNVIAEQPERAEEMLSVLRQFGKTQKREPVDFIDPGARPTLLLEGPTIEMPESLRDELKALGYID